LIEIVRYWSPRSVGTFQSDVISKMAIQPLIGWDNYFPKNISY